MNRKFEYVCKTPKGGLAGSDDCYICVKCGEMTVEPNEAEKFEIL